MREQETDEDDEDNDESDDSEEMYVYRVWCLVSDMFISILCCLFPWCM